MSPPPQEGTPESGEGPRGRGAGGCCKRVRAQLEASRRDLLDVSSRNPLVAFRPLRAKGVRIVDEVPREVYRILVAEKRPMYFVAAPDDEPAASNDHPSEDLLAIPSELRALIGDSARLQEPDDRHVDNKLQTAHSPVRLDTRLRNTLRHAQSSIEEQGVNILYLALGALVWYESESSDVARRAPLVLVPVRLERGSARARFKVLWTEEEIDSNLSLDAKLGGDFGLSLPEFGDADDLDVDDYFRQVEDAVSRKDRWRVDRDAVHLGFFSFSKLLIYKDLTPEAWPEDGRPEDHPLMRALYGGGFGGDAESGSEAVPVDAGDSGPWLDDQVAPGDTHEVLDSDSSQTEAVLHVLAGRNLVIQGPPGTGKSQTIANLVAECVAQGKKVLFVAEKMAALEVVKRRLDSVHVGDACLELHSHKASKAAVLEELKRTVGLGRPRVADAEEDRDLLRTARDRLNAYARAVNAEVGRSKLTPHELVGRLSQLGGPQLGGPRPADGSNAPSFEQLTPESWSRGEFVKRRELVREMQDLVESTGRPRDHAFWGTGLMLVVPAGPGQVAGALDAAATALRRHWEDVRRLQSLLGAGPASDADADEPPLNAADTGVLLATAERVAKAPKLSGVRHRAPEWTERAAELEALARDALEFARIRAQHDSALIPEAWDHLDVLAHRQALAASGDKWWRFLSGNYRTAVNGLGGLSREAPPKGNRARLALLDAVLAARRLRGNIERSETLWTRLLGGGKPDRAAATHRRAGEAAQWLLRLHSDTASGAVHPCVHDALDRPPDKAELAAAANACRRSRKDLSEAFGVVAAALELDDARFAPLPPPAARPFGEFDRWLAAAREAVESLQEIVRFNQVAQRLADQGLSCVTEAAADWDQAGRDLVRAFERRCYSAWLESAWRERPVLAEFDGATQQGLVARFREMDQGQFARNQARVAHRHWEAVPRHGSGGGQMGVLRREFEKKRRHLPLRKLMTQAGNAVQQIKPVFMMSPLSVAKFIPPTSPVRFDLAIFDEASQVRPTEAFGAIARAGQAVVVGDSKQLPPTTFFDRMAEDDDETASQTSDLESILGMFCANQAPERMLKWHYRSRHESLISFSNQEFYDSRLVVFPSPDKGRESTGLHMRYDPEAHYQPGRGGRVNPGEARAVAETVMRHAAESPRLTLGVAAFSLSQARAVEDQLEILRRQDSSCEAFFAAHPEEPFFVKNLENVQGDERDVILISVGYGKRQDGHMPMNFGPLNQDGGERRLNVLVTRARRRCWVFANFEAADLDLRRTKARGVEALKTFLHYARTGKMELPRHTGRAADSPFEEAVARELGRRGHQVDHQVGSAGFFVDLAVVDPDRPGRYLLGVECDGASYHSARSARDRDRLRQQVLEGLGWTIHRIWSTDWFRNPGREMEQLEESIARAVRAQPPTSNGPSAANESPGPRSAPPYPPSPPSRPPALVREAAVAAPAQRERCVPYAVADFEIALGDFEFHEVPVENVAEWLAEVVSVESPVHWEEACARVVGAAGLKRAGARIKERVLEAVRQRVRDGAVVANGDFLWRPGGQWRPGQAQAVVRCRHDVPGGLRQIGRIAPEEIGHALVLAVRDSHGVRDDDAGREAALREAARTFGFKRMGKDLRAGLQDVLERLVEDGTVESRGGFLYEAEGSPGERNP